jgi:DNA polymerase III sliding clamp (beta) subunit (PCNA family)
MNLNKANFAVAKVASTDKTRQELNTIRIEKNFTAASNGYSLAIVGLPKQNNDEVPAVIETAPAKSIKPFNIPAKSAKDITFYKMKCFPDLNDSVYIDVKETNKNGTATFVSTDLQSTSRPTIAKEKCHYPKVFDVFPANDTHRHTIRVNIDYLINMLQVAKTVDTHVDIMVADTETLPIEFYSKSDEGQEFLGLLMPVRK